MNRSRPATFRISTARVALLALIGLLAACQQTRFEAPPTGELAQCDQRWVGAWRVESSRDAGDDDEGPIYWVVGKDCGDYQMLEPDGESDDDDEFTLRYITSGKHDFIVDVPKPDADAKDSDWESAYMLVRYEFRGDDEIRAYDVDNRAVARMIVDGGIAGRTEVRSKAQADSSIKLDSVENLVYGSSAATDAVIRRKGVFVRKPWLVLHRVSEEEATKAKINARERRSPEGG